MDVALLHWSVGVATPHTNEGTGLLPSTFCPEAGHG